VISVHMFVCIYVPKKHVHKQWKREYVVMGRVLISGRKIEGTNTERDKEEGKQKKVRKSEQESAREKEKKREYCVYLSVYTCVANA